MNRVELTGRLTKKPELRYTESNIAVLGFNLAVNRDFKNSEGVYETDFINCTAYKKTAEIVAEYCDKGDLLGVCGQIRTRNYEKDGKKVYVTEIAVDKVEFLATKGKSTVKEEKSVEEPKKLSDNVFADFGNSIEIEDEDLAF